KEFPASPLDIKPAVREVGRAVFEHDGKAYEHRRFFPQVEDAWQVAYDIVQANHPALATEEAREDAERFLESREDKSADCEYEGERLEFDLTKAEGRIRYLLHLYGRWETSRD